MKKMGRPLIDLTGMRFGRLVVIEFSCSIGSHAKWKCVCDCGKETVVYGHFLRSGHTTSCGCFASEQTSARSSTHGKTQTRIYNIWHGMKKRCYDKNQRVYPKYGGRGITVCPEWESSFDAFYQWAMRNGYSDDLTIDRIDNDGNYEPGNCRWVDMKVQCNNKSVNHTITAQGKTKTVSEWARSLGVRPTVIFARLDRGWSEEESVTIPVKIYRRRKNEADLEPVKTAIY